MTGEILIIDDDKGVLESLDLLLKHEFKKVVTLCNPKQVPFLLDQNSFDVVLLDMNFSTGRNTGNEGIFWLNEILKYEPEISIIMITAYGDIDLAVKAMKMGAIDFLQKPWKSEKLQATVNSACKLSQSKRKVKSLEKKSQSLQENIDRQFPIIVGESPQIREVKETISKIARTETNVLITGENGTGKELIAREIHRQSNRFDQIFVSVDLGSLNPNLFESELFGHEKGAFTDAKAKRIGRFEVASGGTLFLDEIGNLPESLQSKLLSALEKREITPLGSNKSIPIDIRLISATNKNLEEMVHNSLFREDLYYRINTIPVISPPLRERKGDVGILAEYFLSKITRKYDKPQLKISNKALDRLKQHSWRGNIRELQHVIENAVIMADHNILKPSDFYLTPGFQSEEDTFNLQTIEKNTIKKALFKYTGNYASIANELGISRTTLYHKIKKYDL